MNCRHCGSFLEHTFLDLGFAPPSNAYLNASDLKRPELYFPLKIKVCDYCWLVQTEDCASADALFTDEYAYFSSTSQSWLQHAERYAETMISELQLSKESFVIEIASNDGYLLKNFVAAGIPCLGIEPTGSTADEAEKLGVPVLREFFGGALGKQLAQKGQQADLIAGNNVYAHVPDINDFTKGLKAALKPNGIITLEFPHLMRLVEQTQFDTVYHEHFSYLSLTVVQRIFDSVELRVWHVEELPTHGGSLRVFGCHQSDPRGTEPSVDELIQRELAFGLCDLETYLKFQLDADRIKNNLLSFLIEKKVNRKRVVGYGAAAKGNTLLNYAGVKSDLLPVIFDAATAKQGKFMPGSHIPILSPEHLSAETADYVLILPWNIADEVVEQNACLATAGVKFVTAVPAFVIL
jgi:SAM-dependent methyltransferase